MARLVNPVPEYPPLGTAFFFKSGTNSPLTTYADNAMSIPNAHPVPIPADGKLPNVFFEGSAKMVVKDSGDVQFFERDPVGGANITGPFAIFDSLIIYDINDIVEGSDGLFYISLANSNQANDPVTPSPSKWSEFRLVGVYNASESYSIGDVVQEADGSLWASQTNSNLGNTPNTDTGTNWLPAVTGIKIAEVATLETRTTTVIPHTGGGALTALRQNELQDGGTYTLPLANSVLVNQTIEIELPDKFAAFNPVVNRSGADTISDNSGTDTSITFISPVGIKLTSNGVDDWRL